MRALTHSICNALAFGVAGERGGLTPRSSWSRCENARCKFESQLGSDQVCMVLYVLLLIDMMGVVNREIAIVVEVKWEC